MAGGHELRPYVAGLLVDWMLDTPRQRHRRVDGSLAFVDISGFTRLSERLAARGKVGAEQMSDLLDATFTSLLDVAYSHGAWLVKWGGDAVLLLFEDDGHAARACTAAYEMRRTLRTIGQLPTAVGSVKLRMSVGVHTGSFDFFVAGPLHKELVITGPAATLTASMEAIAEAGEIVVSPTTAAALDGRCVGSAKSDGFLLARSPGCTPGLVIRSRDLGDFDLGTCLPLSRREHILEGGTDGEHRQVAVAFVEFSGIDAMLAADGGEAAADAVEHVIAACQTIAARHQVSFWETDINKNGGKVMLVAGAPSSVGDEEDRMLATTRSLIEIGGALQLRIGVNSGRVFTGGFGPPYRRTLSLYGDAVNLAARLMGKAGPGQVYVADTVLARSRQAYTTTPLEPFLVKGKVKPIRASVLGAARAINRARHELPMVGRSDEQDIVSAALADACSGSGQIIEIEGLAGLGKSRLVDDLVAAAIEASAVTEVLSCDEYHSDTPYFPIRLLLRRLLRLDEKADATVVGRALLAHLKRLAPQLLPFAPLAAAVADAEVPMTAETAAIDDRFRKERQEQVLVELLGLLCPGPTVVVVEDCHLMDEASADLMRELSTRVETWPWLLVTSRRPSANGYLAPASPRLTRCELSPLDNDSALVLITAATDDAPLPPHDVEQIAARCGGNPLFLLELCRAAREAGGVTGLPDSVEGVIAADIDRLAPSPRRLLRVAAVLGVWLDRAVLEQTLAADGAPLDTTELDGLSAFLEPVGDRFLRFRQTLARDTAYEGLPFARRSTLHAHAGEVIERGAGDDLDERADLLSLHFFNAQRYAKALRYARVAGRRAQVMQAHVGAAEYYARALDCARRINADASVVSETAEALGDVFYRLGELARGTDAYAAARKAAGTTGLTRARLCFKTALIADRAGSYSTSLRWLTSALRGLEGTSRGAARLRADIWAEYGLIRHWQGRDRDAVHHLREAILLATRAHAREPLATALLYLDRCEMTLGAESSGKNAERALRIWRSLGDRPWEESRVLNQLGIRAYFAGRWDDAVTYYEASRDAALRAGDRLFAAAASGNAAEILSDQGRLDEAEPVLHDALRVWKAAGAPSFIAFGFSQLGRLAARAGRFDDAHEWLGRARAGYLDDGEQVEVLETDARIAECLLLAGSAAQALAAADEALQRAPGLDGAGVQLPLLHRVRGSALAQLGQRATATEALEQSLAIARERNATHEIALTMRALLDAQHSWHEPVDPAVVTEQERLFAQLGIAPVTQTPALPEQRHIAVDLTEPDAVPAAR